MHCQLLLALKIKTRKVRQKDIENNNHISNKDRDKRNKKKEIQDRKTESATIALAQQYITRTKIFLDIVKTLYAKKEYAPMMYIIKKK